MPFSALPECLCIFCLFNSLVIARTLIMPFVFRVSMVGFNFIAKSSAAFLFFWASFFPFLPNFFPRFFAACNASLVLILIWSRSCSAKAASMCRTIFEALGLSTATNSTLLSIRVEINATPGKPVKLCNY
jgi:hypothetical protein